jgi:hypothetical protein
MQLQSQLNYRYNTNKSQKYTSNLLNIQHIKIFVIIVIDLNVVSMLNHVQICLMLIIW